jgi:hypothetical protein
MSACTPGGAAGCVWLCRAHRISPRRRCCVRFVTPNSSPAPASASRLAMSASRATASSRSTSSWRGPSGAKRSSTSSRPHTSSGRARTPQRDRDDRPRRRCKREDKVDIVPLDCSVGRTPQRTKPPVRVRPPSRDQVSDWPHQSASGSSEQKAAISAASPLSPSSRCCPSRRPRPSVVISPRTLARIHLLTRPWVVRSTSRRAGNRSRVTWLAALPDRAVTYRSRSRAAAGLPGHSPASISPPGSTIGPAALVSTNPVRGEARALRSLRCLSEPRAALRLRHRRPASAFRRAFRSPKPSALPCAASRADGCQAAETRIHDRAGLWPRLDRRRGAPR